MLYRCLWPIFGKYLVTNRKASILHEQNVDYGKIFKWWSAADTVLTELDDQKLFSRDMTSIKGPIIFSVCGGEVNFEGGNRKKADLIKGGIKFGRNMVRGERNYEFVQGGIHFLIIRMYNKVLNGQSKPCLQDLLSEQHHAKQLSVSCTFSRMFQILCC